MPWLEPTNLGITRFTALDSEDGYSVQAGVGFGPALLATWSEADQALLAGILNYWFLNRTLEKVRGGL